MNTFLGVLLVILVVVAVISVVLYFLGRKLEERQVEQQTTLEAVAQAVSVPIISKKRMKTEEANLPKMVYEQTPEYMRQAKVPVVKTRVGPKVMILMADEKIFVALLVKIEAKVVVSGLYITEIKSIRGGAAPAAPRKKSFFVRFKEDKSKGDKAEANKKQMIEEQGNQDQPPVFFTLPVP